VAADATALELTIAHVNDAHSKLDPALTKLTVTINDTLKSKAVYVELGGITRMVSAIAGVRKQNPNVLFLNAGDMFQGSLYFTQFVGAADVDFWNLMKLDAATLGNHEFDKGPDVLNKNLLFKAAFPIVSSNVDASAEPLVTANFLITNYYIKQFGSAKVGIIGLTTTDTPNISSPGKNIVFNEYVASVGKAVANLTAKGVNKIVLLTHIGYDEDKTLAAKLSGVDVIVGGHSHTLLGDFSSVGMTASGQYPTEVKDKDGNTVLVVQAYQWVNVLGNLNVSFDAGGKVVKWAGAPKLVASASPIRVYDVPNVSGALKRVQFTVGPAGAIYINEYNSANSKYEVAIADDPDSTTDQYDAYKAVYGAVVAKLSADPAVLFTTDDAAAKTKLEGYSKGVRELEAKIACTALEDLPRGPNKGPGPLIADSMVWKTGAQIGIMNPGGVRINLQQGTVSVAKVYELQPFGNTLVTVSLKGSDVVKAFEDMIDMQIGGKAVDASNPLIYVSGVRFTLDVKKPMGQRVSAVMVKDSKGAESALDPNGSYKVVVNNFMAAGGDKNATLGAATGKYDTGYVDSEAFLDFVQGKELSNIKEDRISIQY
jgi:5'-nucleotidase/UDP-sugar diphosphatase